MGPSVPLVALIALVGGSIDLVVCPYFTNGYSQTRRHDTHREMVLIREGSLFTWLSNSPQNQLQYKL